MNKYITDKKRRIPAFIRQLDASFVPYVIHFKVEDNSAKMEFVFRKGAKDIEKIGEIIWGLFGEEKESK